MGELILIFIIALIFIGPKKLPELAKGIGQGVKEFQKAAKGFTEQLQNADVEEKKHEQPEVVITHPEIKSTPDEGHPSAIHDDQDQKKDEKPS